ncbi:uncharacterized protein LOC109794104 [Cajanus cajan]|uniref:uncharacterized protein LOC109794104 n=1 Tax=Cajanus cajan TaxID=3821 RepID=UPI00098D7ACE|nr:uncharacterized protein LOC109794104 [Cajanus cajan]
MIDEGENLNWDNFKRVFLEMYFSDDVRSQKEVEFLDLKQGNDIVAEYASKFDALVRYCSHYHGEGGERAKCIKFVNGLRLRIYDRENRARVAFYKGARGPMDTISSGASSKSKPYSTPAKFQGNQVAASGSKGKGHISTQCLESPRPRVIGSDVQIENPKAVGRIFALGGTEAARS